MNQPPQSLVPLILQQSPPSYAPPDQQAPARVRTALEFLTMISFKTMTRGMANSVGFEQIEGQKLSARETDAQSAACNLLSSYFQGKLEMDGWEKVEQEGKKVLGRPCNIVKCWICLGRGVVDTGRCELCEGKGSVMVMPNI